jgi:hypothetical protein
MAQERAHALSAAAFNDTASLAPDGTADDTSTMNVDDAPQSDVDDPAVLDPVSSERRYYRDPFSGFMREIWRPGLSGWVRSRGDTKLNCAGDGDGDQGTDYYDRQGGPLPLDQRWRLFQVSQYSSDPLHSLMLVHCDDDLR